MDVIFCVYKQSGSQSSERRKEIGNRSRNYDACTWCSTWLRLWRRDKYFKVEADVRVEKVTSLLPGYNCGGCGFPGCSGMAEALSFKRYGSYRM